MKKISKKNMYQLGGGAAVGCGIGVAARYHIREQIPWLGPYLEQVYPGFGRFDTGGLTIAGGVLALISTLSKSKHAKVGIGVAVALLGFGLVNVLLPLGLGLRSRRPLRANPNLVRRPRIRRPGQVARPSLGIGIHGRSAAGIPIRGQNARLDPQAAERFRFKENSIRKPLRTISTVKNQGQSPYAAQSTLRGPTLPEQETVLTFQRGSHILA